MQATTEEGIQRARQALNEATASYEKAKATGDQGEMERAKKRMGQLFGELAEISRDAPRAR